jgi:IS5 family transposase
MRPKERRDSGQGDLFRARLDQIIDLDHPLAKLALTIDWRFLEGRFGAVHSDNPGQPPLPTRLMAGLSILKHAHNLSDEELCARFLENPYFQLFCGEEFFRHKLPFDRSSLTRWRQRMGEEKLVALIQESLNAATRTGAARPSDFSKAIVDTTVQPKAAAFPTDAKLMHRARERLARLAKKHGVRLRQSYARLGKRALMAQPGATPTPSSSNAPTGRRAACAPISGGCCATSSARPETTRTCARSSPSRCRSPSGCAISARMSAAGKSIRCTPPRSNASARA